MADAATDDGIVCRMILDVHEPAGSGAAADVELAFTPILAARASIDD